ncbi:hypothetical protein D3C80_1549820 [compost metagenome]
MSGQAMLHVSLLQEFPDGNTADCIPYCLWLHLRITGHRIFNGLGAMGQNFIDRPFFHRDDLLPGHFGQLFFHFIE